VISLTRVVSLLLIALIALCPVAASGQEAAQNFDLGSTDRTLQSPTQAPIQVGGQVRHLNQGDRVTPAELAALNQIIATGRQNLVLTPGGSAAGGQVNLRTDLSNAVSNLIIPQGVTALVDFSRISTFETTGNLVNSGRLFAFSQEPKSNIAIFESQSITNSASGLLSSRLPFGLLEGISPISQVDLRLSANSEILNAGTIESSRSITLVSGSGKISNSGTIQAHAGNLNLNGSQLADLTIFGAGGKFQASTAINVRDANYAGFRGTTLAGGDYLSQALNLHGGDGEVSAVIGQVSGTINSQARSAHVTAVSDNMILGEICMTGDPTFYNVDVAGGDITLAGNITVGENLAIIASGDILNTSSATPMTITARDGSGQGYNIVMVAGANFTSPVSGGDSSLGGGALPAGTQVTISKDGAPGGNINLSNRPTTIDASSTSANLSSGSVNIAAFSNNGAADGIVNLSGTTINTSATGTGQPGYVYIVGGSDSGTITVGTINASSQVQSLNPVLVSANEPKFLSGASTMTFEANGTIAGGDAIHADFLKPHTVTIKLQGNIVGGSLFVDANDGLIENRGYLKSDFDLVLVGNTIDAGLLGDKIEGATISLTSLSGQPLTVTNGDQILGPVRVVSRLGPLTFSQSSVNFSGPAYLVSSDTTDGVVISPDSSVTGLSVIKVNSPVLNIQGQLEASQVVFNDSNGYIGGTILNPTGDVVLPTNLVYPGEHLTILASGNITAASTVNSIKLANPGGNGGNLTMIAGFDFVDTASANPPPPSAVPTAGSFTLVGPSTTGGSILLNRVNIDVSSTSKDASAANAGSVLAVANSGNESAGIVSLGNITAKATSSGKGGFVHLVADGGIVTKSINTSGGGGNMVLLEASKVFTFGTGATVSDGNLIGEGQFVGLNLSPTLGASIKVEGTIITNGLSQTGGSVSMRADGPVSINGNISTVGAMPLPALSQTLTGGPVIVLSRLGSITTKSIDTSAKPVSEPTPFGQASHAGNIALFGATGVTVKGNLVANGANRADGGGNGGAIGLVTGIHPDPALQSVLRGGVRVTGYISAAGGNSSDSAGGSGGQVTMHANTVQVLGSTGGVSIKVPGGKGVPVIPIPPPGPNIEYGPYGQVFISTNAAQDLPANLDLTSKSNTIAAMPGAVFRVKEPNSPNGTAGSIFISHSNGGTVSGESYDAADFVPGPPAPGQGLKVSVIGLGQVDVSQGANPSIHFEATSGIPAKRTLLTPSEAVAIFQQQRGHTPLTLDSNGVATGSGAITIEQGDAPNAFTKFTLPAGLELNVVGVTPVITLPAGAHIGGDINFTTLGATALIDFQSGNGNMLSTAHIDADGLTLILSTSGSSLRNSGRIDADRLLLSKSTPGTLVFSNIGHEGIVDPDNGIWLSRTVLSSMSVKLYGRGFVYFPGSLNENEVMLSEIPLPTRFEPVVKALAINSGNPIGINLNFDLLDQNGNSPAYKVGGDISASTISIRAPNRTLEILPSSSLRSSSSMLISAGRLTLMSNSEFISESTLKIDAPAEVLYIQNNIVLHADKGLILSGREMSIGNSNSITAGIINAGDTGSGVILPSNVLIRGGVAIVASGVGLAEIRYPALVVGTNNNIESAGGDVVVKSPLASIIIDESNFVTANGGNIQLIARGQVQDKGLTTYHARGLDLPGSLTGGIEIAAGVSSSTLVKSALSKPAGIVPGSNVVFSTMPPPGFHGVIWGDHPGVGQVGGIADVTFNGGALVLRLRDAPNMAGFSIGQVGKPTHFIMDSVRPIAEVQAVGVIDELVLETGEDEALLSEQF
jgi:hypothetical protein